MVKWFFEELIMLITLLTPHTIMCVVSIVLSAYILICMSFEINEMSEVEYLNKVGDRTLPCDTPVLILVMYRYLSIGIGGIG